MKLLTRLFALIILTLLPIVGTEIYNEIDARAVRAEEGRNHALRLVRLVAQQQSKVIEGAHQLLTALGRTSVVQAGDAAACHTFFTDLVRSYPQYLSLFIIDMTGQAICTGGLTEPAALLGDRSFFKLAIAERNFAIGEYDVVNATHQKVLYIAQPYYDATGTVIGVVAAGLSLDWLNDEIARIPLPSSATVSVIDRQGTILVRHPGREQFVGHKIANQSHSYLLSGGEGVQDARGFDGVDRIYSYTPLPGGPSGLTLSVGLDKGESLKGPEAANRRDIMVIAGSCILAFLSAGIGARAFIGRPIQILLDTAEHWRAGDLNARVPCPEIRSEFGRLGAAFNTMAAAIGVREQDLEHRVQERMSALEEAMAAQQAAEAALHEARKMETVGRLTGGVAHDFNNFLAAIVGNIELARSRLDPGHPGLSRLDAAMQSANRGAALVQQLLAFARRQHLRPEVVDLNRHIRGSQDMLRRLLRSDVIVEVGLAPEAWRVRVDPSQLEAAILNLAINARDAMPNGGTLRLETKKVTFADHSKGIGLAGDFVALTVSDTGVGIPPEIVEKVFEPFFTTKEVGAGSGLGLSMVQGFVQQSAGSVAIESLVGQGTSVTLYLPRTTTVAETISSKVEKPIEEAVTVLLVEDDCAVRLVTADLLEMIGYSVKTARSAGEAIACFDGKDSRIDVLITNLLLADGLDGIELTTVIRSKRPDLPVLLVACGRDEQVGTKGLPVLTRPFNHVTLEQAVRDAIGLGRKGPGMTRRSHAFDRSV